MTKINLNKVQFLGFIKDGQLFLNSPSKYKTYLQQLNDGEVILNIEKPRKQRSLNQNSYYWGVIIEMIAEEQGIYSETEKQDLHFWLMKQFLTLKKITFFGKSEDKDPSSRELSTVEFNEYIDKITIWAAEFLNLTIPAPSEVYE